MWHKIRCDASSPQPTKQTKRMCVVKERPERKLSTWTHQEHIQAEHKVITLTLHIDCCFNCKGCFDNVICQNSILIACAWFLRMTCDICLCCLEDYPQRNNSEKRKFMKNAPQLLIVGHFVCQCWYLNSWKCGFNITLAFICILHFSVVEVQGWPFYYL